MARADYRPGTELDEIIKKTIMSMAIDTDLRNITYKQQAND